MKSVLDIVIDNVSKYVANYVYFYMREDPVTIQDLGKIIERQYQNDVYKLVLVDNLDFFIKAYSFALNELKNTYGSVSK